MIVASSTAQPLRILTLAMTILATAAIELAIATPGTPEARPLTSGTALLIAPMLAASCWLGRGRPETGKFTVRPELRRSVEFVAFLALMLLPLILHPAMARWTGQGTPLEVALMAALRNLGLGLATLSHRPAFARLAALVSLFLMLMATSTRDGLAVLALAGAYGVVGVLWLMLAYWGGVAASMVGRRGENPPALTMVAWASIFALVMVAATAFGPTRAATVLAEWVASSGGTGDLEPAARAGVNDGDNEVSASKDPRSIGFTDSEVQLESDRPSLYDSFSDMYGEPVKPKAKQERMVALQPQKNQVKDQATENLQAGRTFATARLPPIRPPGRGTERPAKALIYISGKTPLHLKLMTYDRFDGMDWEEENQCGQHCPLELVSKAGAWLRLDAATPEPAGGAVGHRIKIGTLDSSTLPLPSNVTRFRVGSVDRPEFFGWAQAGLIRMVERTVPAGTVIDTESTPSDPDRLRSLAFESPARDILAPNPAYLGVPGSLDPRVVDLVRSWTQGTSRGWSQVEAVVAGVRGHCLHDRTHPADGVRDDVVGRFLLGSRCGPDYQFASAAAVALRLLGYPCRVVSGFYAGPSRFDPVTCHTPVTVADVHFWVEVLAPGATWAAVEPTPGYELMTAAPSLGVRLARVVRHAWARFRSNLPAVAIGCGILTSAFVWRRRLLDFGWTLRWVLTRDPARDRAVRTLRLLELRSGWAGLGRPLGRTPMRWYRSIASNAPAETRAEMERLLAIASWAAHAPEALARPLPWSEPDIYLACRRAARSWTLNRFRECRRSFLIGKTMP